MSLYDPLGFITPITISARIFMRSIWKSGINWDDEIKEDQQQQWVKWINSLKKLKTININRCIRKIKEINISKIELHVFNDASQQAYCTVSYLRILSNTGKINVSLVFAKSRVQKKN